MPFARQMETQLALYEEHRLDILPDVVDVFDAPTGVLLQMFEPAFNTKVVALKCPNFLVVVEGATPGTITHYPDDRVTHAYDVTDAYDLVVRGGVPLAVSGVLDTGDVAIHAGITYAVARTAAGSRFFIQLSKDRGAVLNSLPSGHTPQLLGKIGAVQKKENKS